MDMTTLAPVAQAPGRVHRKALTMPSITPGNRLYLYQLLRREIGTGRQTLLAHAEEVLAADGLAPQDFGLGSVRELFEGLGDMVRVTVFKKGNTYVTLLPNAEWDRLLDEQDAPAQRQGAATKGKPWKHKSRSKRLRPVKPRHRAHEGEGVRDDPSPDGSGRAEGGMPADGEAPSVGTEARSADAQPSDADGNPRDEGTQPPEGHAAERSSEPPEPSMEPPSEQPVALAPTATPGPPEDQAEPEPRPSIRLTVTYDPYDNADEGPAKETTEGAGLATSDATPPQAVATQTGETAPGDAPSPDVPEPQSTPTYEVLSPAEEAPVTPIPLLVGLPEDFAAGVSVPDGPLSVLYQLLPPTESPLDVLSQDWQVARSTRAYRGTRRQVSFPLRLTHPGSPGDAHVLATIRRTPRPRPGKPWTLVAIDDNDGSQPLAGEVDLEGLPEAGSAVERLLARSVDLGSPDEALSALAQVAEPEDWDLPGHPGGHGLLRLYLSATFRAVLEQGLIATAPTGDFAAFDTGLLSPLAEPVFACLRPGSDGFAWRLLGFSTRGEGALATGLARLDPLPQPPDHWPRLSQLAAARRRGARPELSRRVTRALGEDGLETLEASLRRCSVDCRLTVPGLDVETGDVCLLVPLDGAALSVALTPAGALHADRVLDLAKARAEARLLGRSLPGWLTM